jgi:hypothetical protein
MRLTAEDEKIIEEKSALYGINKSTFVRRAIRGGGVVCDPELVDLLRQFMPILRRSSANMNQSLKYLHANPNDEKYVRDFINDLVRHEKDFAAFLKGK